MVESINDDSTTRGKDDLLNDDSDLNRLDDAFTEMTSFADSLIESIRNDESASKAKQQHQKDTLLGKRHDSDTNRSGSGSGTDGIHHNRDTYDSDSDDPHDDDEIAREMFKLRRASEVLRRDLENFEKSGVDPYDAMGESSNGVGTSRRNRGLEYAVDEKEITYYPGAGGATLNIILLVANIIMMIIIGGLFYHSMYNMLDGEGRLNSPFSILSATN